MVVGRSLEMKRVYHILRLSLALVFIYASVGKILHPAEFAAIIPQYKVLPLYLVNPAALFLPWLELLIGLLLILEKQREGTIFLVNVLLIIFWVLLVVNYSRGININC